ncbi:MAG: AMP-binding protein [Gammaproteobacteria bacterium]|nr:AMP-binding protein [Gammaproteobacteria bacterium]
MAGKVFIPGVLADRPQPAERHAPALECGAELLDYERLARRVQALAANLANQGVASGSRVALAARRDTETYAAMLSLLALGAAYVPLDLAYPAARLTAMLESAEVDFVAGSGPALASLPAHAVRTLALESDDTVGDAPALPQIAAARLAYILFTSGSTGTPKGVAMPRAPLTRLIDWHRAHPRLSQPARTLAFAPMSFDVHFQELHSTLATGGCLVLIDEAVRRDPASLLDALDAHRVERLFLPYVALQMLADAARRSGRVPRTLTDVISAGETLRITPAIRSLFRALPGARLHNHYGPTAAHVVTALQLDDDPDAWPELPSIGKPLPHVQLALRRSGDLADLPAGQGELWIGGDCLADGYIGQPRLTAQRFVENPEGLTGRWFASGDLACRDGEGNWQSFGRIDTQTKIDGFRVEPAELEVALLGQTAVQAAAVDARELPAVGRQLVAWVVPAAGAEAAVLIDELRKRLRRILPVHLQPAQIHAIEALPKTPSGKIDLKALAIPDATADIHQAADPLTRVIRAWSQLLGYPDIDPDANMFDLGARSLSVVRLLSLLEASGAAGLEVADVYAAPTPRGQAAHLAGAGNERDALDAAGRRGARQRAAFASMRPDARRHHA